MGDLNGDGSPDFVASAVDRPDAPGEIGVGLIINDGAGGVAARHYLPVDLDLLLTDAFGNPVALSFVLFDLNGDEFPDLVYPRVAPDAFGNPAQSIAQ